MKNNYFIGLFIFGLLSFFAMPVLASLPLLNSIQIVNFPTYNRLIFKLSAASQYHVFVLENPYRVVVDFQQTRIQADLLKNLDFAGSTITKSRIGYPKPGTQRFVFDMAISPSVKTTIDPKSRTNNYGLFVDIYENSLAAPAKVKRTAKNSGKTLYSIFHAYTSSHLENKSVQRKKPISIETITLPQPRPIVIVVDAGHGGKDPGTIGTQGTKEKDVVLYIARQLAKLINNTPNMRAVLTRDGDYFVPLGERLKLSRKGKADLFIAIHADSYFNNQSTGASVYALSRHGASSMRARWIADRENHSELGGVDLNELTDKSYVLRSVLIDLAQTATITDSITLGTFILDGLDEVTTLHYERVEQAPFMVLKSPDIPSILVETGFLSNPKEEARLRNPAYRDKLARALLEGIRLFVIRHPISVAVAPSNQNNLGSVKE